MGRLLTLALALLLLPLSAAAQDTLAFPNARGWAAYAKGGSVDPDAFCHVTNLNDNGAGSLRNCAEQDSVTIVFDTAGVIGLSTNIDWGSYVTVAGQTAQGDLIIHRQFGSASFRIDNDTSLILAYLSAAVDSGSSNQDNCFITGKSQYVYFHYTGCFGDNDEAFDISPTTNDTVRFISIEGHVSAFTSEIHKGCFLIEDDDPDNTLVEKTSIWKTAGLLCGNRAPWAAGGYGVRFDNYMMYCPSSRRFEAPKESKDTVAFIRGYFKNCPLSESSHYVRLIQIKDNFSDSAGVYFPPNTWYTGQKADSTTSAWASWCKMQSDNSNCSGADTLKIALSSWPAKFEPPRQPPSLMATVAWDTLITQEKIGRYRYMGCDGEWVIKKDTLLRTALKQTQDSTVKGFGAFPNNHEDWIDDWGPEAEIADSMCTNTDGDPLPDRWEILQFGDLTTSDGSGDQDSDNFRDFTEYAWGYDPNVFTSLDGLEASTYGDGRNVYEVLLTVHDTLVVGTDTLFFRRPNFNFSDLDSALAFYDDSTMLVITYNAIGVGTRLDSAQVDSICVAWGRCVGHSDVRTITIGGLPPGTVWFLVLTWAFLLFLAEKAGLIRGSRN